MGDAFCLHAGREGHILMAKTVLIVEDDRNIADLLRLYLEKEGYTVVIAPDGMRGVEQFRTVHPSLVLLDVMLPGLDGWGVCRAIRAESQTPIIMLTAKSETEDKVNGLKQGADDYITKPFNPIEVLARVRSQLRRYTSLGGMAKKASHLTNGGIEMDDESKIVTVDGEVVSLTPSEYNILKLLMENPGRVFSSTQIYERIWNEDACGSGSVVAVHIRHLREKIEIDPSNPRYLKVVWGLGYKIEKEAKQ